MGRSNAIVVGVVVLGPLILGLEGYAGYRSHHRQRATALADTPPAASPEAQDQPAAAPAGPALPADPPARDDPPPPAAESVGAVEAAPEPALQQRQRLLLEHRRQIIQAADEQVFDLLSLPDAQRAAIRAIDDQFGRALETGSDPNAEQTRRSAIADLLGPDVIHRFTFVERKAERRAREQLRPELVRGH